MKTIVRFSMAVALLVPIGVLTAGPAGAAGGTSCKTQTGKATFTPGLTQTAHAQSLLATTTISGCVGGSVKSGVGKSMVKLTTAQGTCAGLAKTGSKTPITETITWNNHKTSTLTGGSVTGPKVGQATITLKITKGLFVGLHASTVITFKVGGGADCSQAHPIKSLTITGFKPFVVK